MKKYNYYILAVFMLILAVGCEEDLEVYNSPDNRINFVYEWLPGSNKYADSTFAHTFVFDPATKTIDTVWFEVIHQGFLANYDRKVTLEQIKTGNNDAIAGTHYVAFNDAAVTKHYIMPANASKAKLPIIVLRDASLKIKDVTLKIRLTENADFKNGYEVFQQKILTITDILTRPYYWDDWYVTNFMAGVYGDVKYQFMIDVSGLRLDNEYFKKVYNDNNPDIDYLMYMQGWFQKKLDEYNAERAAQSPPLPPLAEKDGTVVSFY